MLLNISKPRVLTLLGINGDVSLNYVFRTSHSHFFRDLHSVLSIIFGTIDLIKLDCLSIFITDTLLSAHIVHSTSKLSRYLLPSQNSAVFGLSFDSKLITISPLEIFISLNISQVYLYF